MATEEDVTSVSDKAEVTKSSAVDEDTDALSPPSGNTQRTYVPLLDSNFYRVKEDDMKTTPPSLKPSMNWGSDFQKYMTKAVRSKLRSSSKEMSPTDGEDSEDNPDGGIAPLLDGSAGDDANVKSSGSDVGGDGGDSSSR